MEPNPAVIQYFSNTSQAQLKERPPVLIKDPKTSQILGVFPLITWGRGYACVSTGKEPWWILAKNIKLYL